MANEKYRYRFNKKTNQYEPTYDDLYGMYHVGDDITDEDLDSYASYLDNKQDDSEESFNFPLATGLILMAVGGLYLLQSIGVIPGTYDYLGFTVSALGWIGFGIVLLVGSGLLTRKNKKDKKFVPSPEKTKSSEFARSNFRVKRLYKSQTDKKVAGVCGGIAEWIGVDSTLIRILFVIMLFTFEPTFLIYLLFVVLLPRKSVF